MKTNRAPEKLYIDFRDRAESTWRCAYSEKAMANDIEYIRKDVFIEKACSWLKENKDKYLYNTGEKGEYIPTCSSKMIEEFRKAMKGE